MRTDEYASYDALGLVQLLRKNEISVKELVDVAREGISTLNPKLNFMSEFSSEGMVADDIERATRNPDAPLAGLPFLIKESHNMKGLSLAWSSRLCKGVVCTADNEFTTRLRSTRVVTLGSTNMPELGSSVTTEPLLYGPVRNPWDIDRMTGGSSGGAAAAVAAGAVPMAQSSDGGGSIRIPAHCCGNFGLKPTSGRTPLGPFSSGGLLNFTQVHVNTRTVRDSAAFLDHVHGNEAGGRLHLPPPGRPYIDEVGRSPGRLRVAFMADTLTEAPIDEECATAVRAAAALCEDLGHHVEQARPDYDYDTFYEAFLKVWAANLNISVSSLAGMANTTPGPDTLETSSLAFHELGARLSGPELNLALSHIHQAQLGVDRNFEKYDVFISPVTLKPAVKLGTIDANAPGMTAEKWFQQCIREFAVFTPIFNATGHPAMSVPLHQSASGLPVGVQFAARHCEESTLFRLASQLEAACPWIDRTPPVSLLNTGN